jgi:hypothetical protein
MRCLREDESPDIKEAFRVTGELLCAIPGPVVAGFLDDSLYFLPRILAHVVEGVRRPLIILASRTRRVQVLQVLAEINY